MKNERISGIESRLLWLNLSLLCLIAAVWVIIYKVKALEDKVNKRVVIGPTATGTTDFKLWEPPPVKVIIVDPKPEPEDLTETVGND